MILSEKDKRVIRLFTDAQGSALRDIGFIVDGGVFSSKHLSTDGRRLDINGLGGRGVAEWKELGGGVGWRIIFRDLGKKSQESVHRYIVKTTPKNWLEPVEIKGPRRKARLDAKGTAKPRSRIVGRFPAGNVIGPMMLAPGGYEYRKTRRDPKDPWAPATAVKKRMTAAQKKALAAYRFAVQQEDRYLGSVFANAQGQKRYEALTQAAYQEAKRLGLGIEHGL
jgi:hypothetical protein